MQPVDKPAKSFVITAIVDNGMDWEAHGIHPGDGQELEPRHPDRFTLPKSAE